MTDQPAARDHAEQVARLFHDTYERLAPEHGYRTREASAKPWNEVPANNRALMVATVAEVLRALAGAPAPDVASLVAKYRAKSAEFLGDWQDWDSHDGHERCGQGIAYSDVADELELLAAAPEGVDAADEQHEVMRKQRAVARAMSENGTPEEFLRGWRAFAGWLRAGMPVEPDVRDGPDLEAQGAMADELTAAQAAIQRVRDVCAAATPVVGYAWVRGDRVLRALDGETTEEQR